MHSISRTPAMAIAIFAVFSLALLGPVGAHGDDVAWKVLGSELTAKKTISLTVEKKVELTLPVKEPVVTCGGLSLDSGSIGAHGEGSGTLLFSSCSATGCELTGNISAPVVTSLVKKGSLLVIEAKASSGSSIMTIPFKEPCGLSKSVSGSIFFECLNSGCETNQAAHTAQLSGSLVYAGGSGGLSGTAKLELSGEDAGSAWQALMIPAGNWRIEKSNITKTKEVTGALDGELALLLTLGGNVLKISCHTLAVKEGLLLVAGEAQATLELSKCETSSNGKAVPVCNPVEPITSKVKARLLRYAGVTYVLVRPLSGEIFTQLKFSEECALITTNTIRGSLVLECPKASCEKEEVTHLVLQAPEELFPGDRLTYGLNLVRLDGGMTLSLIGAELGKAWSGIR